jgi:hypothetical protein
VKENNVFEFRKSEPRWINFENHTGEKGKGAMENNGGKGHPCEIFNAGEEKVLCDFEGTGIIRRIWITLSDRSTEVLKNVYVKMYWDDAEQPQVNVPLGDFFCMGLGETRKFENHFFTTGEGKSFVCTIPMPFRKHAKILLCNYSDLRISHLFYDINLTLEELSQDAMYFCADFKEVLENELEKDIEILDFKGSSGRFLGTNIAVIPNDERYHNLWWGEGEVKIYIDGDTEYPTMSGTGAEDYVGAAWGLGEFHNDCNGCVMRKGNAVSIYRFHLHDEIYFKNDIRVTLQALGGGPYDILKDAIAENAPLTPAYYGANGVLNLIYKKEFDGELSGWVNFFRQDHYRTVAYYYTTK